MLVIRKCIHCLLVSCILGHPRSCKRTSDYILPRPVFTYGQLYVGLSQASKCVRSGKVQLHSDWLCSV